MSTQAFAESRRESDHSAGGRVAVVTDDMKTISQHFGMARHYLVYEVSAGEITGRQARDKPGHGPGMHEHHGSGGAMPGMTNFHGSMLSVISDCSAVIAGGMGTPMYAAIKNAGMRPYITRIRDADEAVRALLAGRLDDNQELLH